MQCRGTWSSASKKRALSLRVCSVSVFTLVRDANELPGSLKPMWPSVPMPSSCTSTPPAARIFASYSAPACSMPSSDPSGTCTRAGVSPRGSTTSRVITER